MSKSSEETGPVPYDLSRQDRIQMGRLPALQAINERFARHFRLTLSSALRKVVDVSVRSTELIKFGEYMKTLPIPTALNLFRMEPLQGHAIISLESRLIFTMIDLFFGGTGELEVKAEGRDYSAIEWRLIKRVTLSALEDLEASWRSFLPVKISYARGEVNPQFVAIVPSSEVVIVTGFDVEMGRSPMSIAICIPFSMIEPIAADLSDPSVGGFQQTGGRWKSQMLENLAATPITVSGRVDFGALSARGFLGWRKGEILTAPAAGGEAVDLFVGNRKKFRGVLTANRWRQAVRIEKVFPGGTGNAIGRLRQEALALHERAEHEGSQAEPAPSTAEDEEPEDETAESDSALSSLKRLDPMAIANYITHEHPQTISLILAHLEDPATMAAVLRELPEHLQSDVTYRLSIMDDIQPGIVNEIDQVLAREMEATGEAELVKVGGISATAETLNALDRETHTRVLATIEESNPDLAEQIRELMFTFDDLVLIDSWSMQVVLKEIPPGDLVFALSNASEEIRELVFSSMSQRGAQFLHEDLRTLGRVSEESVNQAQENMVKVARGLEEEGKIVIGGRGGGAVA